MRLTPAAQGHLAMLSFSAFVAGSYSLGALVANEIAPPAINAFRYLVATLAVGLVVAAGTGFRRSHFQAPWRYLLVGALFAVYFVTMFEALKTATPVSTGAVFTLLPLMTAFFAFLVLRQMATGRIAFALIIGAVGAVLVIFRADIGAMLAFELGRGEKIFLIGCTTHALVAPLLKRFNRGEPALVTTTLVMGGCFVCLMAYGWRDILDTPWHELSLAVWIVMAYLIVFASAATTFLTQFAAMRLHSAKVMAYTYLTPAWVICWELALGHGAPPAIVLPGVGLTILALILLLKGDPEQELAAAKETGVSDQS
ncbi:DMT family transporter [Alkalilacustris brevis]|uniref:DMT family transporter n=1 Tax=Alkalilacustris brevis TaxID=2026338 RepID=UPI000E0D4000|nr:DMT family transporter [Alkalilacustris brevis]